MRVQKHLLNALEDLVDDDYNQFKWYLQLPVLDNCEPIKKAHLQNISRNKTVSVMIERYGEESAVNLTLKILKEMNFNGIAEELRKALAASPSASSPAVAPATMMANQEGTIVAPHIMGSSITTMNIIIKKDS